MSPRVLRNRALSWALPLSVIMGLGACGSSDITPADSKPAAKGADGSKCTSNSACVSNLCQSGVCVGDGRYTPANDACTTSTQCASGICTAGKCAPGQALPNDFSCVSNGECQSGVCSNGACAAPASTNNGSGTGGQGNGAVTGNPSGTTPTGTTTNPDGTTTVISGPSSSFTTTDGAPPFEGMGTEWRPLTTGCDPNTASECGGACEARANPDAKVIRAPAVFCFGADSTAGAPDPTPDTPAAMIEQVIESVNGTSYVHIRVTFDPAFVDNTFGENSDAGWGTKGHTFADQLTKSDHVELKLTDASGATVMDFKQDYIHSLVDTKPAKPGKPGPGGAGGATSTSPVAATAGAAPFSCQQYDTLGVSGGDGAMVTGSADNVLAVATSIDRNINGCGYCASTACGSSGNCTVDSPKTDANYTPNSLTPNWNYAVVYEVWLKLSAFDAGGGFGQAYITFVHASPSKASNDTLIVVPSECPPTWVSCPPGQTCPPGTPNNPGTGTGGAPGTGGSGNVPSTPGCPVNYQLRPNPDGSTACSPIPYAGWPDRAACPAGYKFFVDISNETQYCVMQ